MIVTRFPSQNPWPLLSMQLLFVFSLYRLSNAQDNSTTCDVPWVEPLANTSVTCHFPRNVNETNSIFGVSFESNERGKKSQDILDCGWFPEKLTCSINKAYKYNDTIHVSNALSLEIPQASAEHIGIYRCHLGNIKLEKPCEFRVKVVGKTMCVLSSVESNTRTSLTCYYPGDLNKTRTNFTVYHYSRTGLTEVIMACEWKGDNLTCNTTHGYEFNDRVSNYLTLKIPMALESQEGTYSCHISGAGFLHYDNCTVTHEKSDAVISSCQIPSVEEAEPTALTCKFSVDINMTKMNFTVVRFSDAGRKDIISCTWLGAHLTCTTALGYQVNNSVTDHVVIQVPQSSHNHSGMYACHVMGTVSSRFEPCEFIIQPATTSFCNISRVQEMETMTLTCTFNVDINMTKRNFAVIHLGGQDRKGADIINCTWMNEQLNCTTAPGYEFNKIVTDHFSMKITQISNKHSGIYTCHVLGSRINGFEPCEFITTPGGDIGRSTSRDQSFVRDLLIAVDVILMCIPLSLILVIIILRKKNTSHTKKSEDMEVVDERTPMMRVGDGGRDQETHEGPIDEDMVRIQKEIVDSNQKASKEQGTLGNSPIQSEGEEGRNHQTSPQSGSQDKDTQPPSIEYMIGDDKSKDILGEHSPVPSDAHEEERNSPQRGFLDTQLRSHGDQKTSLESESRGKRMSVASQKKKKRRRKKDVTTNECLLPITDPEAALLAMKITEIPQKPENKKIILEQLYIAWLQWVLDAFPDLDSRAYFLPPVYINRVPMTIQSIAGQDVLMLQSTPGHPAAAAAAAAQTTLSVQESDLRDDAARQRVLFCLQEMFKLSKTGLFGISQLRFEDYLSEVRYAAKAVEIPLPDNFPKYKTGAFDILLIHKHYGVVLCEVKSLGLNLSSDEIDTQIRKKLQQCVSQLDKAEAMLSHLVSDIASGLRITKIIAFPNLTTNQVQQAILNDDMLTQDVRKYLETTGRRSDTGLFLTSDQLSDPKTPWDVSSEVLKKLENWWQRRVTVDGPDTHMSSDIYKKLMTRFCGPATKVTVQYTSTIRHGVKTLGQAVSLTGERYTALITLFPEQVDLLSTTSPRIFVAGPPGTGKTLVLQLRSMGWLQKSDVYIVSTWVGSRAACSLLYERLLQHTSTDSKVFLKQYNFNCGTDVENAVTELSEAANGKPLMVIADEVGPDASSFQTFSNQLLDKVPELHLWAASCYHGYSPDKWSVKYLTKSLRSPPAVVREVKQAREIEKGTVHPYSERGVPDHTDGPPVARLYHRGQGHSGDWPVDCVTCGQEVASFLHSLRVGVVQTTSNTTAISSSGNTAPRALKWSDVLVLYHHAVSDTCGVVTALKTAGIPVQVKRMMTDDDIKDLALALKDVVWVLGGHHVHGLERKVVVCLDPEAFRDNPAMDVGFRLHYMSRCTSQLVIVSSGD